MNAPISEQDSRLLLVARRAQTFIRQGKRCSGAGTIAASVREAVFRKRIASQDTKAEIFLGRDRAVVGSG